MIVLSTPDAPLRAFVHEELASIGQTVVDWSPEDELPAGTLIAIIEGMRGVSLAGDAACHIVALVSSDELSALTDVPRPVSRALLTPLRPRILATTVGLLLKAPSYREAMQHRLLAKAVEATQEIIEIGNRDSVIEYVNPAYEMLLGYSPEEALGSTPAQVIRSDQHEPGYFRNIDSTLSRGDTWRGTLISQAKAGHLIHFDTTITPVFTAVGQHTHNVAVKHDITEKLAHQRALIEANKTLESARDEAVAANRAKSEFFANMSHELRTPLNAIIGYSEMLIEDIDDNATVTDLERIRGSGTHLLTLIEAILDISRLEADKVEVELEAISVTPLVDEWSVALQSLAAAKRNRFQVHCAEDARTVIADATRLRQVVLHLLSNACKFTEDGEVTLEVVPHKRQGDPWVELRITDTGVGMTLDQQGRVFQPFVQGDGSTTRRHGGAGLGLAISKRLMDLMGGEIQFETEEGRGSSFSLLLPASS